MFIGSLLFTVLFNLLIIGILLIDYYICISIGNNEIFDIFKIQVFFLVIFYFSYF